MKRYYNAAETPLKYHKFLCVVLWIGGVLSVGTFLSELGNIQYGAAYLDVLALETVYYITAITIRFAGAVGLKKFAGYAWYCVVAMYYFDSVFSLVIVILLLTKDYFEPGLASQFLVRGMIGLIPAVLVHIYYAKRKPLFFPERYAQTHPNARVVSLPYESASVPYERRFLSTAEQFSAEESGAPEHTTTEARFCRYCGSRLVPGGRFCGNCGARAEE